MVESSASMRVRVALPLPLGPYDYRVPEHLSVAPGDFVRVPLGRNHVVGVVWDEAADADLPESKLKDIEVKLDAPPMAAPLRKLVAWVAAYTLAPLGNVLRMAMSVPEALAPPRLIAFYRLAAEAPDPHSPEPGILTPARRRLLLEASAGARPLAELARAAQVSPAVAKGVADKGWLARFEAEPDADPAPDANRPRAVLSEAQDDAARVLAAAVGNGFSVTLLDGVTGSGKTEVYFEAVAAALAAGRQVLVLLPEIAMSAQWLARFASRFGVAPAAWHSELGRTARARVWRDVAVGRVRVLVGARSALFLPFCELGLIVVDEEHEQAFKQEDGAIYHARDMAVVRARLEACPIVLASATPSLETLENVARGRYACVALPARHGGAALPDVSLVDLRRHPPPRQSFLSPPLREALTQTLAAGEQAMLFLNRRGYAPLTLCRACGHRLQCPRCTAWLVEHRLYGRLQCHHCGYAAPLPKTCPACLAEDSFVACGPGVERVAEEARALFPDARIELMTSDTVTGPAAAEEFVRRMTAREIDILIGTQIVAKGHHFPLLTLVGIVDADLGLAGGDLRAGERSWQLLHQVAGRAGRAAHAGRVLLQTHMPDHAVMKALAAGDRDKFLAAERADRERHGWPPFGRLAAIVLSGEDEALVDRVARRLGATAPQGPNVKVLGPAPAAMAILRGRHRRRLLVKTRRDANLQAIVADWLAQTKLPNNVRLQLDIDPYSFL
ncbi:MAG: primosomal protein N' [Rhodospirillales bacterium]|jgi:primosomal protein N' (replication factor Y)